MSVTHINCLVLYLKLRSALFFFGGGLKITPGKNINILSKSIAFTLRHKCATGQVPWRAMISASANAGATPTAAALALQARNRKAAESIR